MFTEMHLIWGMRFEFCNKHGLEVKKPDTDEKRLNDSIYVELKSKKKLTYRDSNENSGSWGKGRGGSGLTEKGRQGTLW